ncbi:unnamed protein product [Linum tenue]|uniref:SNU114 homolog n=1 Tax=Linum tenue TaxID=586396 RepID=A0AAV0NQX6_9ROSI|nr:unnamed protein product [Linum tenue]
MSDDEYDEFGNYVGPEIEPDEEEIHSYASRRDLVDLMSNPARVRNVALVGHIHHGKTSFMDLLVEQTHQISPLESSEYMRYTDTRSDEQTLRRSIKAVPMSLALEDSSSNHILCNIMDAPGHLDLSDEMTAALRLSDGAVLVVDPSEGVMLNTERAIQHAIQENLPIVVVITKVDKLITELNLRPEVAYNKLRDTIKIINDHISAVSSAAQNVTTIDPTVGNVCFASSTKILKTILDDDAVNLSNAVYCPMIGEPKKSMEAILAGFGVRLHNAAYTMKAWPLLRLACSNVFGTASGFTDMLVQHIPSAKDAAGWKVEHIYTGPKDSKLYEAMKQCTSSGPLMIDVVKFYPKSDWSALDAFGRVYSGTLKTGQSVKILQEAYTVEEYDDTPVKEVTNLWVYQGRYRLAISTAGPGSWVLIEGIDAGITKTATLCNSKYDVYHGSKYNVEDAYLFQPLQFNTLPLMRVSAEPSHPTGLPIVLEGLRYISRTYPHANIKVEESALHMILGTGEFQMNRIIKDLSEFCSDSGVEIKDSVPAVLFRETVVESSSMKCSAKTPKRNKITMIAEPLEKGLAEDIENVAVSTDWTSKAVDEFFKRMHKWDLLDGQSVWAFGPDEHGPNVLLDGTLSTEVDKGLLRAVRDYIVHGFQWAARQGPLCDEPMRNVKFKIVDAIFASELSHGWPEGIAPTTRRVAHSAFLMAAPRLMEPVYYVEIHTPVDDLPKVREVLSRRHIDKITDVILLGPRGYVLKMLLEVPTKRRVSVLIAFDHWAIVPGDPLAESRVLQPYEATPPTQNLARQFMMETRKYKGMSEDVDVGGDEPSDED